MNPGALTLTLTLTYARTTYIPAIVCFPAHALIPALFAECGFQIHASEVVGKKERSSQDAKLIDPFGGGGAV